MTVKNVVLTILGIALYCFVAYLGKALWVPNSDTNITEIITYWGFLGCVLLAGIIGTFLAVIFHSIYCKRFSWVVMNGGIIFTAIFTPIYPFLQLMCSR
ncbi:MAG: hypothetical protein Athens101428_620 [Candidatus Berkelbacteria bacterium Athens1014_28]|uniref:Uncharacterized protein n=1 Tax=Candidatus Berkelbacteria bacterium Athens1014_28 TaxID=2017145 RepID=A0A554LL52_9BACT|nr:MAG: hypothetical protein Athens101428_620 [Candidatus Berkelbacteria bacterium Athens1014_28]